MRKGTVMELPEHEKLQEVQPQSQAIGEFIEWLGEQGIWLASFNKFDRLNPINDSTEKLLAQFFKIDLQVLEAEKIAILDAQRQLNERTADHDEQE